MARRRRHRGATSRSADAPSRPATPARWRIVDPQTATLRCLWTATSRPPWRMRTAPAATVTAHPLADQPPRHRVGVPVHLDGTIGADAASSSRAVMNGGTPAERPQRPRLVPLKPCERRLAGRAVHPHIRDLAGPGFEMRLHRLPGRKANARRSHSSSRSRRRSRLALRARPIRRAGARTEPPMLRANACSWVQHHSGSPGHDAGSAPADCPAALPAARRRRRGTRSPARRTSCPASRAHTRAHAAGASSRASPRTRNLDSRRRSRPGARRNRSATAARWRLEPHRRTRRGLQRRR